jgi:hypothetical protein
VLSNRQQDRRDRAAAIRQGIRVIAAKQDQVLTSLGLALMSIVDQQLTEFRATLGSEVTASDFLGIFFSNDRLYQASCLTTLEKSPSFGGMRRLWNELMERSSEFQGALHVLYDACFLLVNEPYNVCTNYPLYIRDHAKKRGRARWVRAHSDLDTLMIELRTEMIADANDRYLRSSFQQIAQVSNLVSALCEIIADLPDSDLLALSAKAAELHPSLGGLPDWVDEGIGYLAPQVAAGDIDRLQDIMTRWRSVSPHPEGPTHPPHEAASP